MKTTEEIFHKLKNSFDSNRTRSTEWRLEQLNGLLQFFNNEQFEIIQALSKDLNRPESDSMIVEIARVRSEIKWAINNLKEWTQPRKIHSTLPFYFYEKYVHNEPLGIILIISPWNYPFLLSLSYLIGAYAAGNCVILKPSEISKHSSSLMYRLLPKYVDPECIEIVMGDGEVVSQIINTGMVDHIIFTGSTHIGRLIMENAAKHLIPVTLELGGKSPTIAKLNDCDLTQAVKSICYGKFLNAGQTCIAPDYLLVQKDIYSKLLSNFVSNLSEWFNNTQSGWSIASIINRKQFDRLQSFLSTSKILFGGENNADLLTIQPTLVDVSDDHPFLNEEIFGPILPIRPIDDLNEAIEYINKKPKPLAIYAYTSSSQNEKDIIGRTSSGAVCINDCVLQNTIPNVPFGGVGESGIGRLCWKDSFLTCSNQKSIVKKSRIFNNLTGKILYPPHSDFKVKSVVRTVDWDFRNVQTMSKIVKGLCRVGVIAGLIGIGYSIGHYTKKNK